MAYIFYQQNLIEDNLHCLDKSVQCATMQNDTVVILNSYARKMAAYEKQRKPDSVVAICENIYDRFYKGRYRQMASCFFGLATDCYLATGNADRAKELLEIYESESGYFDEYHNIEKGREAFYKLKGKYYMAVGMYDSAEVCFRKELVLGHDFNNQNMASNGLARVYQRLGRSDSAAKYALYAYDMNDSIYTRMATSEIAKAKEMYNYGRFQQLAIREKEKSEQMERWAWMLGASIFITLVIVSFIWYEQRKRRKANEIKYHETLKSLYTKKEELKALQSQVTTLSHIIEDKEETIGQQADMMEKLDNKKKCKESHYR